MDQQIDTIGGAGVFEPVEEAINAWAKTINEVEAEIAEIRQLREELASLDREEAVLFGDCELTESAAAKKLGEIRNRRELRHAKLDSAARNFGLTCPILTPQEVASLEDEAARLEAAIKASSSEEAEIFRGASRGLKSTHRLTALRQERQAQVDKLETVRNRLKSHQEAITFRTDQAGKEVRARLSSLISELDRKRKHEAAKLLVVLCDDFENKGLDFPGYFRSVKAVSDLHAASCQDPASARRLLGRITRIWDQSPLDPILVVANEQAQTWQTEEVG